MPDGHSGSGSRQIRGLAIPGTSTSNQSRPGSAMMPIGALPRLCRCSVQGCSGPVSVICSSRSRASAMMSSSPSAATAGSGLQSDPVPSDAAPANANEHPRAERRSRLCIAQSYHTRAIDSTRRVGYAVAHVKGLYAILDLDFLHQHGVEPLPFADAVLAGRPAALQVRAKSAGARDALALLRAVQARAAAASVPLFANDRPDLALLAGCAGVHLGQG